MHGMQPANIISLCSVCKNSVLQSFKFDQRCPHEQLIILESFLIPSFLGKLRQPRQKSPFLDVDTFYRRSFLAQVTFWWTLKKIVFSSYPITQADS